MGLERNPDVASNHDICYARSADAGVTWEKSTGEKYQLPITAATAEYACKIPPNSELINQTSICTDADGYPVIASYWRDEGSFVPQYHILYKKNNQWQVQNLLFRKTAFSLSGMGTKQIPVSRPQVIAWKKGTANVTAIIFRDEERRNKVSVAINQNILTQKNWKLFDLTSAPVGAWEPYYDTELWKDKKILNLFIQHTEQLDAEGVINATPQMVNVLEWNSSSLKKR